MSSKFGTSLSAYSYLIFVLLYVPCVSVMEAAYCLLVSNTVYQLTTFHQHPQYSLVAILLVLCFNTLVLLTLCNTRSHVTMRLRSMPEGRRCQSSLSDCH